MKKYNIHNLIEIRLAKDVSVIFQDEVEFKYKFFRNYSDKSEAQSLKILNIFSYDSFLKQNKYKESKISHDFTYLRSEFCSSANEEIAIEKIFNGFNVYTNGLNVVDILIQILLTEIGYSFIHAGGLSIDKKGILLSGMGGIGKTQIVSKLSERENVDILGDDLVIFSKNGECLAFPKPFMLKPQHAGIYPALFKNSNYIFKFQRIKNNIIVFLKENLPFSGIIKNFIKSDNLFSNKIRNLLLINAAELIPVYPWNLPNLKISKAVDCKKIILIERNQSDNKVFKESNLNNDDSVGLLVSIILSEFKTTQWLLTWLGKADLINLGSFYKQVFNIYETFIENADVLAIDASIKIDSDEYIKEMIRKIEIEILEKSD